MEKIVVVHYKQAVTRQHANNHKSYTLQYVEHQMPFNLDVMNIDVMNIEQKIFG